VPGLLHQPDEHIDAGDGHALRRLGQPLDAHRAGRDVQQLARVLAEEVIVVGRIGIEIGRGAFHRDLAQQAGLVLLVGVMIFAFWNDLERIFLK